MANFGNSRAGKKKHKHAIPEMDHLIFETFDAIKSIDFVVLRSRLWKYSWCHLV